MCIVFSNHRSNCKLLLRRSSDLSLRITDLVHQNLNEFFFGIFEVWWKFVVSFLCNWANCAFVRLRSPPYSQPQTPKKRIFQGIPPYSKNTLLSFPNPPPDGVIYSPWVGVKVFLSKVIISHHLTSKDMMYVGAMCFLSFFPSFLYFAQFESHVNNLFPIPPERARACACACAYVCVMHKLSSAGKSFASQHPSETCFNPPASFRSL